MNSLTRRSPLSPCVLLLIVFLLWGCNLNTNYLDRERAADKETYDDGGPVKVASEAPRSSHTPPILPETALPTIPPPAPQTSPQDALKAMLTEDFIKQFHSKTLKEALRSLSKGDIQAKINDNVHIRDEVDAGDKKNSHLPRRSSALNAATPWSTDDDRAANGRRAWRPARGSCSTTMRRRSTVANGNSNSMMCNSNSALSLGRLSADTFITNPSACEPDQKHTTKLLHLAISDPAANKELVEALLKAGAKMSEKDSGGTTPLHEAVDCGKEELLKLLLNASSLDGATGEVNINDTNDLQETPLDWALAKQQEAITNRNTKEIEKYRQIVKLLEQNGGISKNNFHAILLGN